MSEGLGSLLFDGGAILAGRSALLDFLVALPMRNDLIKAAIVCGSFVAAWHAARTPRQAVRQRSMLLMALLAALVSLGISTTLSSRFVPPRPYIFEQQVYRLDGQALIAQSKHTLRLPQDGGSRQRLARLAALDIPPNDFGTYPSDHASLFVPLAMGVWLVSRRIGMLAVVWTLLAIFYPKLHLGLHSPRDLACGVLLGMGVLGIVMGVCGLIRPLKRGLRRLSLASERYAALSAGLLFIAMYEICSKFEHLEALLSSAKGFL
jgi:hypothetical protein